MTLTLEEIEEEYSHYFGNNLYTFPMELMHFQWLISRIRELDEGIRRHRDHWMLECGQVKSTYYSKRDQDLYAVLDK